MRADHEAITLVLQVASRNEDAVAGVERWLLGLWQLIPRHTLRLWRDEAPISLEYLSREHSVSFQVHLRSLVHAELSRRLLQAQFPGIDIQESTSLLPLQASQTLTMPFTLRDGGWLELKRDSHEGLAGVLNALPIDDAKAATLVQLLLQPTWIRSDGQRLPAFWLAGRVASSATSVSAARTHALLVAGAFGQYTGLNGITTSRLRQASIRELDRIGRRGWPRRLLPPGHPATPGQIAALFHPPTVTHTPFLATNHAVKAPITAQRQGISLGVGRDAFGKPADIHISPTDLLRHALVIGPTGSGKSTLLANLACGLIEAGVGVTVLDPHGALVEDIAMRYPKNRLSRGALLRFADTAYPIALNPLVSRHSDPGLVADELIELVQRLFGRSHWGPLLELSLRNAAMATMEIGGSLADSARWLEDPAFREALLPRVRDPEAARFFQELGTASASDRRTLPAAQRLRRLLGSPLLRDLFGQQTNTFEFAELADRGETLLCDLSELGTTAARLIGSLLLLMLRQTMMARAPRHSQPHIVILDEASWFLSSTVGELMDQARKYGIGLVIAVQRLGQLAPEQLRDAVLANAGATLSFRIHDPEEAHLLARHLGSDLIGADDLRHLARYEAYLQQSVDGERLEPAWFRPAPPVPQPTNALERQRRLIDVGRHRFARPRAMVEKERDTRSCALTSDDPEIRPYTGDEELPADAA